MLSGNRESTLGLDGIRVLPRMSVGDANGSRWRGVEDDGIGASDIGSRPIRDELDGVGVDGKRVIAFLRMLHGLIQRQSHGIACHQRGDPLVGKMPHALLTATKPSKRAEDGDAQSWRRQRCSTQVGATRRAAAADSP